MTPAWLTDTVTPDLDRALHYTALWGLEALELRTVGGPGDRVPFVNERKLRRRLEEHEQSVAAIVPGVFEGAAGERVARLNEVAALDEALGFCARIGCSVLVASAFQPEEAFSLEGAVALLRRAGDAAARHGVTLALLNEYGMQHPTGTALAGLLAAAEHGHVRAAWSPAEALRAGEDPADGLAALAGYVAHVRFRDGRGAGEGWEDVSPGEGVVDWPAQLRTLRAQGYAGAVSLEVHVDPKPKTGLHAATRLIHGIRNARKAG